MVSDLPNLFSKEDVVIPPTFKNSTKEEFEAGLGRGGLEYLRLTRPDLFLDAFSNAIFILFLSILEVNS